MNAILIRTIKYLTAIAVMTVFSLPAMAVNLVVSATVEPAHIAVGEAAQLTVTVTGASANEPVLPQVYGLTFASMGQSSEYQLINGDATTSSSYSYLVTASRPGQFTIPAIKIGEGDNSAATQPIVLQVTGTASPNAPVAGSQTPMVLPLPNIANTDDGQTASDNGQPAFLRLVTPKRDLHVGELVPVQIKAYFRAGVQASINGLPSLSSDAFTLNPLDGKPPQTQESIGGQPYAVLTWTTALTAVKAGNYSLSLEMPVLLTIHENASRQRGLSDDPFSDPIFDDFFGHNVQKNITLSSQAAPVNVRALPATDQPASFSGAVGQFNITAEASPDHVAAGDPITLRLTVTGRGNFDRVTSDLINNTPDWKSYKPVARFASADSVGFEGAKTFEQAIVPLQAGHLRIPAVRFSYFDPETETYVTRTTTPLAIDVAPVATPSSTAAAATPTVNVDRPEFYPNRVEPGRFVTTLRPLFLQPWFLMANFLLWCGLATVFYSLHRYARRTHDPRLARARLADRVIRDQLAAMDSAIQHAQTAAFFTSARCALQQRLGERWGLGPETITLTEINDRLNGEADGIRPIFQMADQVAYSHESLPVGDLAGWKRILTEQLKQLELQ